MTVLDEVRAFIIRLAPEGACDDCIAERLNLSIRQHATHQTRELAGSEGFERRKARGFEAVMQRFTAIMIGLWLVIGFALVVLSTR